MGTVDRSDPAHAGGLLRPAEVASLFAVTPKTIARWNEAGILAGERTEGGHRRYPATAVHELHAFLEEVGGC